ncbi:MAG: hypothetical protein RLZ35_823 [Pseudomonadota bacterium]|jgi:UDP-N-acetylmuramoyl-L-alanyl-D-glutamate--2,6-diaminopimelate ligase
MSNVLDWLDTLALTPTAECHLDSRSVSKGDVFVALQGERVRGQDFILDAIQRGAVAVLTEGPLDDPGIVPAGVSIFQEKRLREKLAEIALFFYGNPAKRLSICGITGTNGKTSVAYTIAQLWSAQPQQTGAMIGTIGVGLVDRLSENTLTTPDILSVYRHLKACADQGATQVAIEASSHALMQGRIAGLSFESVVFTNLTQDHLDYHQTMEAYWAAKRRLLTDYPTNYRVINLDDPYGLAFCEACRLGNTALPKDTPLLGYTCNATMVNRLPKILAIWVSDITRSAYGITCVCHSPWGKGTLKISGIGDFQLSNALAAVGVLCSQGADFHAVLKTLPMIKPVPGRLNKLGGTDRLPTVMVDFAHTPDALAKALQALRPYCAGKLTVVFGCGGERDKTKRPLMLREALQYADTVFITADNPRSEPPEQIVADMLQATPNQARITIELNRRLAIEQAIANAGPKDMVLLAGKGHEMTQVIGTEHQPFSDIAVAQEVLSKA